MISIRKNIFETNSSSTHALCISKNETAVDETLFLKEYNISPVADIVYKGTYTTIEDKLIYFLSIICMNLNNVFWDCDNFNDDTINTATAAGQFYKLLKEIFPNTEFNIPKNIKEAYDKNLTYNFEDGEWVLEDSWNTELPDIQPLLDKQTLKNFMQYGTIYFFSRDEYKEEEIINPDLNILVRVSG